MVVVPIITTIPMARGGPSWLRGLPDPKLICATMCLLECIFNNGTMHFLFQPIYLVYPFVVRKTIVYPFVLETDKCCISSPCHYLIPPLTHVITFLL
uniref:Uncharacterized protein n=1 Tax=Triticum urartu TaxID=4572 RepID=A0A8R7UDW2_TRIUA